jgi:hypothetical protein
MPMAEARYLAHKVSTWRTKQAKSSRNHKTEHWCGATADQGGGTIEEANAEWDTRHLQIAATERTRETKGISTREERKL